jgi:Protein of unknown function (DUF2840)
MMSHKSNFCGSRTASASGAIHQTIPDGRRRVSFAPGSIFAFVRWASNPYDTVVSRIHILRSVAPGERYSTVPFVQPGGEILLALTDWPKVEKVFHAIEVVEALALIRPIRHQSIGTMFTTGLASTRRLGLTPIHSTRPGSGAKESHCE